FSTKSRQSKVVMMRRLVITLRTVTFAAACRWCSARTRSCADVPRGEALVEPARRRRRDRVLIAQALGEPHGERRVQRRVADRAKRLRIGRDVRLTQQEIRE